ncbi:MAG TPA: MFS transporter [Dongiaceae bacterium]|jgi:PAT family beta-lactamase induction signal transducer AmpG|nr:MFS transporter [Dongiaceae bacterium]
MTDRTPRPATGPAHPQEPDHHLHPSVFLLLILPFGMISGFLTVSVAFMLAKAGVSVEKIAALIALSYIPHTWKFAWAPIADTTLSRKTWYLIGAVVTAAGIWATSLFAQSGNLTVLSAIVVISNVAVTFLGMSVESLMAYDTPENEKGRAAGWFQAGNLGGVGLGGGVGLWLAHRAGSNVAGAGLAVLCLLCILGLFFVTEPEASHRQSSLAKSLVNVFRDIWGVARSRRGMLALILCFLPIGSGAASNLWSAVSGDWHASAHTVELVTGILSGVVAALGCLAGGWICDRMNRKTAYAMYGVLQALCAVAMALAPRTEAMYAVFTSLYAFVTGLTYAGFSAFVLEAMGKGAAATKYNVFAALSNTPIAYMTRIDGHAHDRHGAAGMLYTEAVWCLAGLLVFALVAWSIVQLSRRKPAWFPALAES